MEALKPPSLAATRARVAMVLVQLQLFVFVAETEATACSSAWMVWWMSAKPFDSSCAISEQGYEEEEPFQEIKKSPVRDVKVDGNRIVPLQKVQHRRQPNTSNRSAHPDSCRSGLGPLSVLIEKEP